jgi:ferredoxin
MSMQSGKNFRASQFDVLLVSGVRLQSWPSSGVRTLSQMVSDFGLEAAWIGGEDLNAKGIIPLLSTGGIVLAEDSQSRIHRLQSRAIVKWNVPSELPDPFLGMFSAGVLPGLTAYPLFKSGELNWNPGVAILGSSNRAFRFGSELLESGCSEVFIIEPLAEWGGKRYAGWEVEKRRFETLGGKLIEAAPLSLSQKSAWIWEFRIQDSKGVRLLEVSRVVTFGPFKKTEPVREYPPGSLLFEFDQDINGLGYEEESATLLATRIIKALLPEVGVNKQNLDFLIRKSRSRLKGMDRHQEDPFFTSFQGKWLSNSTLKSIKGFEGVPQREHFKREVASIECIETIGCNLCEQACPTQAIKMDRLRFKERESRDSILLEDKCIACGLCLQACPSATPVMLFEKENHSMSKLTLPARGEEVFSPNEMATLVNRKGDALGSGRVLSFKKLEIPTQENLLPENRIQYHGEYVCELEVPTHLLWEARTIRKLKANAALDREFLRSEVKSTQAAPKVEVFMNGEKRLVREKVRLSQALFETGQNRANDMLDCVDGSCGLCQVDVDGIKALACQTDVRRGMSIKLKSDIFTVESNKPDLLCHCLGISLSDLQERVKQGKLSTIEAALSSSQVGQGKCHGQLCMESAKRGLAELGIPSESFVDWRFPWTDWTIDPAKLD